MACKANAENKALDINEMGELILIDSKDLFVIGLIILIRVPVFFIRIFGLVPMFIGMGGFWSRYSNSSSRLPVYLAHKRGKRSIYLEIEKCKKNIVELEGIIEKKNKENWVFDFFEGLTF